MAKSAFLPNDKYILVSVSWSNPYTEPSLGFKHLWAACIPQDVSRDGMPHHEIIKYLRIYAENKPYGYSLCLDFLDIKNRKRISHEARANMRRKKLADRIMKKDPLFFDHFLNKAIAEKPEYYDQDDIKIEIEKRELEIEEYFEQRNMKFINSSICKL